MRETDFYAPSDIKIFMNDYEAAASAFDCPEALRQSQSSIDRRSKSLKYLLNMAKVGETEQYELNRRDREGSKTGYECARYIGSAILSEPPADRGEEERERCEAAIA